MHATESKLRTVPREMRLSNQRNLADRSYLELCAEVAQRQTIRHRQEVRARKWRDRRHRALQLAVIALIGSVFLFAAVAWMM